MESLVSYCSDDEENESCPGNETSINQREMDVISRQADEDTNYDNVQMDMSEESNNNNSPDRNSSGDSSDSEKSSVGSSHSRSRKSSSSSNGNSPARCSRQPASSHSVISNVDIASKERSSDSRSLRTQSQGKDFTSKTHGHSREYEGKDHASENLKKDRSNRDRGSRNERVREKDHSRDNRSRGHSKDRREGCRSQSQERRSHSRGKDQRSSPHGRDRDRHHARSKGGSPDRKRARSRSRSPGHSYSSSSSSRSSKDSHRTRSRSRDRQSSSTRSRSKERISDRHRSRSKERQRSRSRERRRGAYEKKPNKLTILERLGIELRPPDSMPAVTPQQLLQRSMEQQVAQVKSSTGIELPKYYNPAAMNPMRYAEQMQKRRLLWGNKSNTQEAPGEPKPTSNNKWEGTTFAQDQDGKMTAKFKRLMGIKDTGQGSGASNSSAVDGNELLKKQEELFNSMEMQYEVARVATHTHRGVGLGFGTFQYPR
ncbi:hypothetical protein R5R35_014331 [Gryllus longicercus]|uniref:Small acidic protein-like domain-containing protein n=1 Tax=Gryllus longicercus TaxID=2509291 RepID=A0AAN9Z2I3_9ORTH